MPADSVNGTERHLQELQMKDAQGSRMNLVNDEPSGTGNNNRSSALVYLPYFCFGDVVISTPYS